MSGPLVRVGQYAVGFAAFLVLWWGGSLLVGSAVLPTPPQVFDRLSVELLQAFAGELARTVGRGLAGFAAALVVALPAGVLMGRRRAAARSGFFPLLMLQSAPPLFWITPLVLWLGTRGPVPVVVAFLVALPLLTLHTTAAIRHIPDWEYDVFAAYAPRRRVLLSELFLPHLIPALRSNVHLGILAAVKAAMLAEWFAAQDGFGRVVRVLYQTFAMTEFVAWSLLFLVAIGSVSLVLEVGLRRLLPVRRVTTLSSTRSGRGTRSTGARSTGARGAHPAHRPPPGATPPPDSAAELVVRDLCFGYDRRRPPLFCGVNLHLRAGRPTVLYGRSGCGKTTLLKCLAGVSKPWSGTVERPAAAALVFQDDALLAHRDALGNVLLPILPWISDDAVQQARRCLAVWGLAEREQAFPNELSGGMRKRLAMARSWFVAPRLLLLDEPFVNLDPEARAALWELLFARVREATVATLIVTHYRDELHRFDADHIAWDQIAHPD